MKNIVIASLLVGFSMCIAGCSDGGPSLVPAAGTVTLNGGAVAGANVLVLYPDNSNATAITDEQGRFSLVYSNGKPGAVPGTGLKVSIRKVAAEGDPAGTGDEQVSQNKMIEMAKKSMPSAPGGKNMPTGPKNLLPKQYEDPNNSGIKIDIPPGGKEDLKIELSA